MIQLQYAKSTNLTNLEMLLVVLLSYRFMISVVYLLLEMNALVLIYSEAAWGLEPFVINFKASSLVNVLIFLIENSISQNSKHSLSLKKTDIGSVCVSPSVCSHLSFKQSKMSYPAGFENSYTPASGRHSPCYTKSNRIHFFCSRHRLAKI